ncbi:PREDICTED: probable LRR receptor-like serine/threonine-protein kinase At5g63710 [Prunus mume]|uniref:Probable LRR receptor-like serine/threonine-protein kinase At5g63710 n=1 Tax=Prunus mume TaxID=102107 RepID=A0ABM0NP51_PRUMU|nr:PREDICTED: probable LRR receptor-like serine/threonine-protein kinase At5g63710 [Prunus mume]XP_016648336.1 PREDICTED: probable LRR receptor-like serine/threonine-protein kinase At5g63710 [Prunus mume]
MSAAFSSWHLLKPIINWLMLLLLLRVSFASTDPDVEGEALIDLLRALNDSSGRITDWNYNLVSPCFSWSHVTCRNGNVISLSLASNGFSGTLSPSITKLKFLASLDFQDNSLTGLLPIYLANMTHLQNLNLANNNFRGPIPNTWGQLSSLKHLVLRGNHISGHIPDSLSNISGLTELDLSSNELTGRVPMQFFTIPKFNFTGARLACGSSLKQPCASGSVLRVSTKKSKFGTVITSASCGVTVILLIGALFTYRYYRMHKLTHDVFVDVTGEDECKISFGQLRRFSWREIQLATDNFDESNIIGQGGFGRVYKGVLSDNVKVAVKRLTDYNSPGGEAAFLREVQLISVAVHKNLLRLIGFCTASSERILVYPFMKNLSVAYRLRDLKPGEKGLDWSTRKRIAFGAAHGLEYLHEHCNPKIIHRDLKAANILLDDNFEPVLGDFGLAKLVDTKSTHVTTQVRGTMGHIAPEYLSTGKSSEKTDVFGYGITLLELVTGQRAIDFARLEEEEDVLLLDHIKKLQRENRLDDIVDGNMKMHDPKEVETVIQVALLCTQSSPEDRPTMAQVVRLLQGVDLAERWAEWEQLEDVRSREFSLLSHHQFAWAEESTHDQEAIQLSKAR